MAADVERLARFDREAKTLAALNHPNIAAIYGLEKGGGTTALVMELVRARHSPTELRKALSQLTKRYRSPSRSQRRSKRPMSKGSSTATLNPRTSSCAMMGQSRSWTSASRRRSSPRRASVRT
jgi:hypothetical protein